VSTSKFTPAPWRVCMGGTKFVTVDSAEGLVAKTPTSANAHLIAAAPELYEALSDCIAELEAYEAPSDPMDSHNVRLAKARAALAKAGRAP